MKKKKKKGHEAEKKEKKKWAKNTIKREFKHFTWLILWKTEAFCIAFLPNVCETNLFFFFLP